LATSNGLSCGSKSLVLWDNLLNAEVDLANPPAYLTYDTTLNQITFANFQQPGVYSFTFMVKLTDYVTSPLYFPQKTDYQLTVKDCRCTSSVFTQPTIAAADYVSPPSLITAVTSGTIRKNTIDVKDTAGVTLTLFDFQTLTDSVSLDSYCLNLNMGSCGSKSLVLWDNGLNTEVDLANPPAYLNYDATLNQITFANFQQPGVYSFTFMVKLTNYVTSPLYFPQTTDYELTVNQLTVNQC
jgi:hypothetical protein